MPPPKGDVLVVTGGGEYLVVRMDREAPELPAMAEDDLVEAPLQRALEDVVPSRAHVDVAVVAARPLRVDAAHAARRFRELQA